MLPHADIFRKIYSTRMCSLHSLTIWNAIDCNSPVSNIENTECTAHDEDWGLSLKKNISPIYEARQCRLGKIRTTKTQTFRDKTHLEAWKKDRRHKQPQNVYYYFVWAIFHSISLPFIVHWLPKLRRLTLTLVPDPFLEVKGQSFISS